MQSFLILFFQDFLVDHRLQFPMALHLTGKTDMSMEKNLRTAVPKDL